MLLEHTRFQFPGKSKQAAHASTSLGHLVFTDKNPAATRARCRSKLKHTQPFFYSLSELVMQLSGGKIPSRFIPRRVSFGINFIKNFGA